MKKRKTRVTDKQVAIVIDSTWKYFLDVLSGDHPYCSNEWELCTNMMLSSLNYIKQTTLYGSEDEQGCSAGAD